MHLMSYSVKTNITKCIDNECIDRRIHFTMLYLVILSAQRLTSAQCALHTKHIFYTHTPTYIYKLPHIFTPKTNTHKKLPYAYTLTHTDTHIYIRTHTHINYHSYMCVYTCMAVFYVCWFSTPRSWRRL